MIGDKSGGPMHNEGDTIGLKSENGAAEFRIDYSGKNLDAEKPK